MNRRQFFAALFAAMVTGPLIAAGILKAPEPLGISIRVFHCQGSSRIDVLYGFAPTRGEYMCRIVG